MSDYREVNRAVWDERAPAHAASPDYAVERLATDPAFLSDVVRFDLPRLGEIAGLRGVHLQCHIGTDTLSLARLGARMTGLDFSAPALEQARALAQRAGERIEYAQADLYDAPQALRGERFDLVYTGVGALCWLPNIGRWADVVAALLAPGGRLFMREGHPVLWTLEYGRADGLLVIKDSYFEHAEALVESFDGTYVQTEATFECHVTHTWNHGLGEIVGALLDRGLRISGLEEHDSVPWEALGGQMERLEGGEFRLAERPRRLPHSYTLQAVLDAP